MADTRITAISTTYDRDTISLSTDYLIGDRSGGSSFRAQVDEVVLGVLENIAENVGIGTTSPGALLEVESAASTTGVIINNTATDGDPYLSFALSGTKTFTIGVDDGDSDKFKIGTTAIGTNTRLTIDSSGNVGIGTTTPERKLHIKDSALVTFALIESTGTDSYPALKIKNDAREWGAYVDGNMSDSLGIYDNGAAAYRMVIDTSGNVGIGTTSPGAPLHLLNAQNFAILIERSDSGNAAIMFANSTTGKTTSDGCGIGIDASENAYVYNKENTDLYFGTNNAEIMRIKATGTVGIGVTSPTAKLQINGSLAIVDGMTAPSTISGYAVIYVDSADGDLKVKFGDGTVKTIVTDT